MLWQARYVAQIHVADELTNAVENSTLYSDGTSKKDYSYANFDYQKPDGTIIVTGLRCVGGGDFKHSSIRLRKFFLKFQKVLVILTAVFFLKHFFLLRISCQMVVLPRKNLTIFFKNIIAQLFQMLLINGIL